MTGTFSCLDFRFSLHASAPGLRSLLADLYAPFRSVAAPTVDFEVDQRLEGGSTVYEVRADDAAVRTTTDPSMALAHLVWEINSAVIRASAEGPLLLLHAAAAERDGKAVLLPAPSGSGKSTLVTGLIANGLSYLTDDVVPFDPTQGSVRPYPKPISLSRWLWPLFSQLKALPFGWNPFLGAEGYLSASSFGADIGIASVPRLVVVPNHSEHARTHLSPLARPEALQLVAQQSFNLARFGATGLETLSALIQGCECFRLDYSDLHAAVDLVLGLMQKT